MLWKNITINHQVSQSHLRFAKLLISQSKRGYDSTTEKERERERERERESYMNKEIRTESNITLTLFRMWIDKTIQPHLLQN